jgi:Raf kinase inhibitor-like YbhB/YbcL family protein
LKRVGSVLLTFAVLAAAGLAAESKSSRKEENRSMKIQLNSTAFAEGKEIPVVHTCQGKDSSPPLKWSGAPTNTKSLALIADDPDAPVGTWVHWVLYDLPPTTTELAENVERSQYLPGGTKQGINDFKRLGYGGPCPPPGKPHRYYFKIYALDIVTDLKPGATKQQLLKTMEGHVLAEGQLMGTYQRR